jgi:hypothetical protein
MNKKRKAKIKKVIKGLITAADLKKLRKGKKKNGIGKKSKKS